MAYRLASADIAHALDALASDHDRIARALAQVGYPEERRRCLLYTSDAADE